MAYCHALKFGSIYAPTHHRAAAPYRARYQIADTCDEQTAAADCPGSDCVCYDDDDADW